MPVGSGVSFSGRQGVRTCRRTRPHWRYQHSSPSRSRPIPSRTAGWGTESVLDQPSVPTSSVDRPSRTAQPGRRQSRPTSYACPCRPAVVLRHSPRANHSGQRIAEICRRPDYVSPCHTFAGGPSTATAESRSKSTACSPGCSPGPGRTCGQAARCADAPPAHAGSPFRHSTFDIRRARRRGSRHHHNTSPLAEVAIASRLIPLKSQWLKSSRAR